MVALKINVKDIAILPFECQAKGAVYMNGVPLWLTLKPVKVETGNIQLVQRTGCIHHIQPADDTCLQLMPDL